MAIGSAATLYSAYALSHIVDFLATYHSGDSFHPLSTVLLTWGALMIVADITPGIGKYIGNAIAERASLDADAASVRHIASIDLAWHEKESTGNKMKRIDRGTRGIVDLSRTWLSSVIDICVSFAGMIIIISRFDSMLAMLVILYQLVFYLIASLTRQKGVKMMHAANKKEEEITGLWYEIVSNIRSVRVLGMAERLLASAKGISTDLMSLIRKRIFWFQGGGVLNGILESITTVFLVGFVCVGVMNGRYEAGFLILFFGYFQKLSNSVWTLTMVAQDVASAKTNIGRLTDILDEKPNIDNNTGKTGFPASWSVVHIRDLSFSYGDNAVLSNITFDIHKSEKIGIVGLSGAGKSTLFKLLLKEHEDYSGEILVGDVPLKSIKKSAYVKRIAAVLQETEVFNMSLEDNVILSDDETGSNDAAFQRALEIAHITDFMSKLPDGVKTIIGEKGVKLSGGEKQRLGIARAVFKRPDILFLDEATSHLDVESEQKIQDSLAHFFKDVTAVVIAHRLSTIREMDRIIVLENGKIIETGTFEELYANDGRFRDFWDKQKGF